MTSFVYDNKDIRNDHAVPSYPGGPLALARDILFNNLTRVRRGFGEHEQPFLSFRQPTIPMVEGYTKNLKFSIASRLVSVLCSQRSKLQLIKLNLIVFSLDRRVQF